MSTSSKDAKPSSGITSVASKEIPGGNQLRPEGEVFTNYGNFDCAAFLIHCETHDKVLVTKQAGAMWLPYTQLPPNRSWKFGARFGFCVVLAGPMAAQFAKLKVDPPYQVLKMMQLLRVQLPVSGKFRKRLVYYAKVKSDAKNFTCCQPVDTHLVWLPLGEVRDCPATNDAGHQLWGPELVQFAQLVPSANNTSCSIPMKVLEHSLADDVYQFVPRDPPRSAEESLLKSVRITLTVVERVWADFLDHCFPSLHMTEHSFNQYMLKYDFERDPTRLHRLFFTFNTPVVTGYLTFQQLLLGLACMEPNSLHSEYRVRFILRYYDSDNSGGLSYTDLRTMVGDMKKGGEVREEEFEGRLAEVVKLTGCDPEALQSGAQSVSARALTAAIGSHKFRGTSVLCRASKAIFTQIAQRSARQNFHHQTSCKTSLTNVLIKTLPSAEEICSKCVEKKYELATHRVVFDIDKKQSTSFIDLKATAALSSTISSSDSGCRLASTPGSSSSAPKSSIDSEPKQASSGSAAAAAQQAPALTSAEQYSIECVFKPTSAAKVTIELIRQFAKEKGTVARPRGLLDKQRSDLWDLLKHIYLEVDTLLEQEFKCQRTFSPCYIIGDIHGNIEDLISMERTLWPMAPCMAANFLFLGDYVDRGKWGFECALYLIALKILCPNKITLLRGNHEVRQLQRHYSYYRECVLKYGDQVGLKVWELTNKIFDKLPVCATVDDAIFCAHGGIPRSSQSTEEIAEKVQKEIRDPEKQSLIAWEVLWSDPCPLGQFVDVCRQRRVDPDAVGGYVYNVKRGTAWLFNDTGATGFLRNNFLTHIIRAHEVAPPGYVFHFGSKCVTIFSSSHYCGNDNDCGFILADRQRLRVITLDTVNNDSATD